MHLTLNFMSRRTICLICDSVTLIIVERSTDGHDVLMNLLQMSIQSRTPDEEMLEEDYHSSDDDADKDYNSV